MNITEKRCLHCEKVLPMDNFPNKSDTSDGKQAYCRDCFKVFKDKSRDKVKEKCSEFVCEQCDCVYKLKDSLTRHIKQKHPLIST